MDGAPSDPEELFTSYLPLRLSAALGELGSITSAGAVTFRVVGSGEWSLRVVDGRVEVTEGMPDDVVLQITVPRDDFDALVRQLSEQPFSFGRRSRTKGSLLRALSISKETARMVRRVPGSVLLVARDGAASHRLLVSPGDRAANLDSAECTIELSLADLQDAQGNGVPPMQLLGQGKLRIKGSVQIAMALAAPFLG